MGLRKAQWDMVAHCLQNPRSYIVGSCGLGKSRACLEVLQALRVLEGETTALVIAPPRVATVVWPAECKRWGYPAPVVVLNGAEWPKIVPGALHTVTFNGLQRLRADVLKNGRLCPFNTIIVDEATFLKNPSSKRANSVRGTFDRCCPRIIAMTGTPISNGLQELYAQLRFVCGDQLFGGSFVRWRAKYFFPTDYNQYNWAPKPNAMADILEAAGKHIGIFHAKDYDDLHIPDIVQHDIEIELPKTLRAQYKEMEKDLLTFVKTGAVEAVNTAVKVGKLLQLCNGILIERGEETLLPNGKVKRKDIPHKLSDFKEVAVARLLKTLGDPSALILGTFRHANSGLAQSLNAETVLSAHVIESWNRGETKRIVTHMGSCSHGLNLQTGGKTLIWATPPYSEDGYHQTNSRLARPGQAGGHVDVYRVVCKDTIEMDILEVLRNKRAGLNALIDVLRAR